MPNNAAKHSKIDPPPESMLLNDAYKKSSLTAADLATATGLSVSTVRVALAGIKYRSGEARLAVSPDQTVAKLAAVLGIRPKAMEAVDREGAAALMNEAEVASPADLETPAAIAGRLPLVRRVLSVFSTDELHAELQRRNEVSVSGSTTE